MGIPENIDALMAEYDIPASSIARAAGVSEASVSDWRNKGAVPRRANLEKLCAHFGLTTDDILSDASGFAAKVHGKYKETNVSGMKMGYVPLLGRVHAGKPTDPDLLEDHVLIPQFLIDDDPECYALESEGDCMNRVYPEGCMIVVSPNKQPQNGSVAVVTIDDTETVMRRMYRTQNTLILSPDSYNPDHDDIIITSSDERIVKFGGKVVWFQSKEEME